MKKIYYAIEVTAEGEKFFCWQKGKYLYFAEKRNGYAIPFPPALFRTRKEAKEAIEQVPKKGGNLSQFIKVIDAVKIKVVKVTLTY